MKRLILNLCCLLFVTFVYGQKLTVEKMEYSVADLSGSTGRRMDLNGQPCALLKISLAVKDAQFEGNIIPPVEYKSGEYWVYMTEGSTMLRVKHPDYVPLMVTFADYGVKKVEALKTYGLVLLRPDNNGSNALGGSFTSSGSTAGEMETFTVNGVSFNMIRVDGGSFMMGATKKEDPEAESNEKPVHEVTLTTYYVGETEVTQALWEAVMKDNPSDNTLNSDVVSKADYPVNNVSWNDCEAFIRELNNITGKRFRLPTEAEWEYAALGGQKSHGTIYSGSNSTDRVAVYNKDMKNFGSARPQRVKSKAPNELGIYDMSGNVFEWCADGLRKYTKNAEVNPRGNEKGLAFVIRGGCYIYPQNMARIKRRGSRQRAFQHPYNGLRLAL